MKRDGLAGNIEGRLEVPVEPERRRINPRAAFDGWVEISTGGQRRLATARDLSRAGIGVDLPGEPLAPESPLVCEFTLPGISLPLALDGHVAWASGSRLGVRFYDVDPGLAELLENHVAGHL
jgi:hypothetical protein